MFTRYGEGDVHRHGLSAASHRGGSEAPPGSWVLLLPIAKADGSETSEDELVIGLQRSIDS